MTTVEAVERTALAIDAVGSGLSLSTENKQVGQKRVLRRIER
jgi:hypothetical protein